MIAKQNPKILMGLPSSIWALFHKGQSKEKVFFLDTFWLCTYIKKSAKDTMSSRNIACLWQNITKTGYEPSQQGLDYELYLMVGFSTGDLKDVEFFFIAITPRSKQTQNSSICLGPPNASNRLV